MKKTISHLRDLMREKPGYLNHKVVAVKESPRLTAIAMMLQIDDLLHNKSAESHFIAVIQN